MFSGIVQTAARVLTVADTSGGRAVRIDTTALDHEPREGDSVAVDGVCLTVVNPTKTHCEFNVIHETLRRTTLGALTAHDHVNLEAAMAATARFDGHFVQGHVDAVGIVDDVQSDSGETLLWIRHDAAITPLIVPKGSVTINGVSLTIAEVASDRLCVALIPTTLERTNLDDLAVGDSVNIETDIMARTIKHQIDLLNQAGSLTSVSAESGS
jgi:riboflavin synthase